MAIFKCKMCGGDLTITNLEKVVECDFCGTTQTVPTADNEKKLTLFNRANRLRLANEFDKAAGIYENIVAEFPEEAEAYWGIVLCKYGIEYVDDPATGKKIPTCHRSSFESVFEDDAFDQACENADAVARRVYREEAKQIEEIRKGILEVSSKEEPYDIFICYKETDENGDRTIDSAIAQDVYDALTEKGYRVFFSRITLEDKLGQEYEPYIFAALHSAKVMLVFGTDYEYFNAVWVKNEWSRFLQLISAGQKKVLIPCYKGIDAYDMPKEFARLQSQDMGKVGAIQDLLRGIEKLLPRSSAAAQPAPGQAVVSANPAAATVDSLLKRAFMFLEDCNWQSADEYAEKVLDIDPENGEAYLDKFLVAVKANSYERFLKERASKSYINNHVDKPIRQAFRPNEDALKRMVAEYVVPGYLEEDRLLWAVKYFDAEYESEADQMEAYIAEYRDGWASDKNLLRAKQYGKPEISALLNAFFEEMNQELSLAKQKDAEIVAQKEKDYEQFVREFQITAAQQSAEAKKNAAEFAEIAARRAEEERDSAIKASRLASLKREQATLEAELSTLKGIFKAGRRREVEERLATIEAKLNELTKQ